MDYFESIMSFLRNKTMAKTDRDMCEKLEISYSTLDTWKNRKSIPKKRLFEILEKINISIDEFESNMRVNTPNDDDFYNIKKITTVKASAGKGNELEGIKVYETGEVMPIAKAFFKTPPNKQVCSLQVEGESMMPTLHSGDWVLFCEDYEFKGDGLYVLNFSNQLMVKILQLTPKGTVKVISVNKDYESYEIDINETQEHFKVVGKVIKSIV